MTRKAVILAGLRYGKTLTAMGLSVIEAAKLAGWTDDELKKLIDVLESVDTLQPDPESLKGLGTPDVID